METGWLLPDKKIWIREDDIFLPATVISRHDATKKVEAQNQHTSLKSTQPFNACYQRSSEPVDYEDMCNMNILNEPEILFNLKRRYTVNKIYTKIGPTLIAMNPYKSLESLYERQVVMKYREKVKSGEVLDGLLPHVYLTAGGAYGSLKHTGKKQAIVISGESGAGKTENTKYCMKFLTSLSHIHHHGEKHKAIEDIILECNPILQAFGNSKTVRNSNSSRFGKYVRLFISKSQQMTGARIQNYLLEKSRVTSVSKKERSFHIFYYLAHGMEREAAGLVNGEKYEYLEASGCLTAEGIDDKADFKLLKHSLEDVGFSKEDTGKIWMTLGAILLLGNLQFDNKDNLVSEQNLCKYTDTKLAERICKNLGLKMNQLNDILLEQKIAVGKEIMIKKFDKNHCITTKNTLAKALYGRVFDHLIEKINDRLWTNRKDDRSISILDIFGFQIFDKNSFQQLCINFTNQRLQQLYTKYVFDNQLVELKKDGLGDKVKDLVPPDNKALIQLIEKRMGLSVFSLIDEKTALGAAKDEDIVVDLRKMKHKNLFVDPEPNRSTFMILHTQNPVIYAIEGFKYKNQDSVTQEIDGLINRMFPVGEGQEFKGKTLVTKFDKQLRALNEELESSELHFIRCIKPNETKKADSIDQRYVLQQVKYLGVLETIQIRKSAFPFRTSFAHFVESYKQIVPFDKAFPKLSPPQQCMYILKKLFSGVEKEKNSFLIGKQRIYLKDQMEIKLNNMALDYFKNKNRAAWKIQSQFKRFKQRGKLVAGLKGYLKRMKVLKRVVKMQIVKIQLKYWDRYREQVKKIRMVEEENRKKKKEQVEKERAVREREEEEKRKAEEARKREEFKAQTEIAKEQYESKKPEPQRQPQPPSTTKQDLNASKMYDTVVYDSEKPLPQAISPTKPQAAEFKSSSLSPNYINHLSVVNEDTNTLVKGQLRLPMYERNVEKINKLRKIVTHSYEDDDEDKEKDDHDQGNQLDVSPSIDDKFLINSNTIKGEMGHKIINFEYAAFFEKTLRKRKTFFGRKKDIEETLRAKDTPISKSLILLPEGDEMKAIEAFKLLLWVSDSEKTDKIYQPIQKLIELMQNTSQNLRNQVFVQIIKQQNVENQYSAIKMYQAMAIYLHIFRVEENFILAYLSCLLQRYQDPRTYDKIKQNITYLFARSLRHINSKQIPILYLPTQFQIAALMCKRQIPVSIYFSIGNCIIVKVESFETLADIKERVLETAGVNSKRVLPEMIGFFEVMSFENEELEEIPLDDNRSVWDLLTYWEKAKLKFEQTNVKPPDFGLYVKIKFAYELTFEDQESVELFYAQAYFDLFLGRLRIPLPKLLECSAMMKATEPDLDIDFIIPLWAVQDNKAKQQYIEEVDKLSVQYKKLDRHQIRFQFLRNCNISPLFMSITFPTQGNTKLYIKPKRIYIVENDEIIEEIGIRRVLRWGCDESTLMLTIRDSNSERVMTIKSQFAKIVGAYLSTSMKLIMAMKGNP